jgi:hypothetical protein
MRRFVGYRAAMCRGIQPGQWIEETRTVSTNPSPRRDPTSVEGEIVWTRPGIVEETAVWEELAQVEGLLDFLEDEASEDPEWLRE